MGWRVLARPVRGRIAALGPRRRVGAGGPDATLRAQAFDRIGAGVHGLDPPAWDAAFGDQHRLAGLDRGQHLGGLVVQLALADGLHGVNVLHMSAIVVRNCPNVRYYRIRSEEKTSELQSLMPLSSAVLCW